MQIGDKPLAEMMFSDNIHSLKNDKNARAQEGYIQGGNLDNFLSSHEKERAATIYQQMQQMREESLCMFCNQFISEDDQLNQNLYMLQTTDCFH